MKKLNQSTVGTLLMDLVSSHQSPNRYHRVSLLMPRLYFIGFCIVAVLFAAGLFYDSVSASVSVRDYPLKVGVITINPSLDLEKPLAAADSGGFIVSGDALFGSHDAKYFFSYNLKSRNFLWWTELKGFASTTPVVVGGDSIVVATRSGQLVSMKTLTGSVNWTIDLDSHVERPLLVKDQTVFLMTAAQVGYAIDAATGQRKWVYDAGFTDQVVVKRAPMPVVFQDNVVFTLSSGEILALGLSDGKVRWKFDPLFGDGRFKDFVGDATLKNDRLVLTRHDGWVGEVSLSQVKKINWQDKTSLISTSAFRANRLYTGHNNGDLVAYDSSTGQVIWRLNVGLTPSFIVVSESYVLALGTDGRIVSVALDGKLGRVYDLGSGIASPPSLSGDQIFVSTGLKNIYVFKL